MEAKLMCMAQSPKPPSSITLLDYPLAKAFRQTKTLLSGMTFWGPRDHLLAAERKSKTSSWLRLTLHCVDKEAVQIVVIYWGCTLCQAVCYTLFPIILWTLLETCHNYLYFKDKMKFKAVKWPTSRKWWKEDLDLCQTDSKVLDLKHFTEFLPTKPRQ